MARKGIADPRDYLLGRGELYFADSLDVDGRPKSYRTLGHAEAFTLTVEAETLEHFSKLNGLSVKDREVVLQQSINFATQLTEIDAENLALYLSGEQSDTPVTGATVTTVSGDDNVIVDATNGLGKWYDIFETQAPTEYPEVGGTRVYRLSAVTVYETTHTTPYTLGTDYDLDLEMGRIFIRADGSIVDGEALTVDFTYASLTITEVRALTQTRVSGVMKFISRNASADSSNTAPEVEYVFHSVTMSADGDFALIGEEFATLNLTGSAEANAIASPNSPTLTISILSA